MGVEETNKNIGWDAVSEETLSHKIVRLNRSISVIELAQRMGSDLIPQGGTFDYKTLCFHPGDQKPSMYFVTQTNSWYSFCCSKGGGVVKLAQFFLDSNNKPNSEEHAVKYIESLFSNQEIESGKNNNFVIMHNTNDIMSCWIYISTRVRKYLESIKHFPDYEDQKRMYDNWFMQIDKQYPEPHKVPFDTVYNIALQIRESTELNAKQREVQLFD